MSSSGILHSIQTYKITETMSTSAQSTRGRKPKYSSQEEWRQARNARDREKYRQKQLTNRVTAFQNIFQAAPGPVLNI